jgi:hypothetical protein
MYLIKRTFRKNNETVSFFEDRMFNVYQDKMYKKKWTHDHTILEGNVLRQIQVWPNEEQYRQWADDPTVLKFVTAQSAYNKDNQISVNEITATV